MVAGNERSVEMPHFGPRIETISNQSRVSPYPTGLGLRPKASPPVRHGTPLLHAESAGQSQIGRCLTLQRDAHRQQILAPESSGSGCPVEDIANRRSSTPPRHVHHLLHALPSLQVETGHSLAGMSFQE